MGSERRSPIFRIPLILMVVVNLALLGYRLWPWDQVTALPDNGATGIDPAVSLLGYAGVSIWIGSARQNSARRSLFTAAWFGVFAGLLLCAGVLFSDRPGAAESGQGHGVQYGLMAAAIVLWGIAATRGIRAGFGSGFAVLCAIWSAMVSCLLACAALIGGSFYSYAPGQTADPWKQYQGLAIGSEATQALVETLLTATGYLLLGPLVAVFAGWIFASFTRPKK